ncbi:hypothetical protein SAMN05428988_1178 [Chitinophaga sp. YR573]|uniref:DUF6731 family protein n=1 Tax=Chitinophaga sp. YR573 TaxID=1881040 RepID=UPI0008C3C1B0|nr:DUF6731 family protein [Chitinophaga sp. YR573]SEW00498.1 hypothetical protein SAMN05428988_1178 [Chitinophaga sp. YR573]
MSSTKFQMFQVRITPKIDSEITSFQNMLDNMPDPRVVMRKDGDDFDLIDGVNKRRIIYYGTFCLVQNSDLPPRAKLGERPKDLELDEGEGLGHYTSFFFDSTNDIILIQYNRNGITASGIAKYFKRNFRTEIRKIEFNVVINPSEIERLRRMGEVRSLELSVASVRGGGILANDGVSRSVGELRSIADKTNADSISIKLTMGHTPGTLRRNRIAAIFGNLLRADTHGDIKKMEITGKESDEGALETIDFITNKVIVEVTLPRSRHFTLATIERIIRDGIANYNEIKPEIDTAYKVRRNSDLDE